MCVQVIFSWTTSVQHESDRTPTVLAERPGPRWATIAPEMALIQLCMSSGLSAWERERQRENEWPALLRLWLAWCSYPNHNYNPTNKAMSTSQAEAVCGGSWFRHPEKNNFVHSSFTLNHKCQLTGGAGGSPMRLNLRYFSLRTKLEDRWTDRQTH